MIRIFFPLKSNVEWFQSDNFKLSIIERFKYSILLYDEILAEDGTYISEFTENNSISFNHPPGSLPDEERIISFERDIVQTPIQIGIQGKGSDKIHTIFEGNTIARFKIDYLEILKEINFEENSYIRPIVLDKKKYPKQAKDIILKQSRIDQNEFKHIKINRNLMNDYIKNLNEDLVTSILLKSSLVLDHQHESLLAQKCFDGKSFTAKLQLESIALRKLLTFVTPDLNQYSIQHTSVRSL